MTDIFIAGISMSRFGPQPDETVKSLSARSVNECLKNAGAEARQVEAVFFSNAAQSFIEGPVSVPGQIALQGCGLQGLPIVNVANGCASGSTAFWLARNQLLSGQSDIVMAAGTEKMTFNDANLSERARNAFKGVGDIAALEKSLEPLRALSQELQFDECTGQTGLLSDIHTLLCRVHMVRFSSTQRQLAIISSKNHANSTLNPKCHYNRPFSVDEILAARPLAYPLTAPMYAPPSDGSAATLLCTKTGLKKLKGDNKAVRVDSCILTSGKSHTWDDFENHLARRAASRAYAQAGIGPEDVDLAELHDASSFGELFMTELLGFCEMGGGGEFAESGASALHGRLPVNPSGGLQSKGHPVGATGLGQIFELVTQLRYEAGPRQVEFAHVAVQQNGGGLLGVEEGAAVVTVLSR